MYKYMNDVQCDHSYYRHFRPHVRHTTAGTTITWYLKIDICHNIIISSYINIEMIITVVNETVLNAL